MLKVGVLVSGGGTNLEALIKASEKGLMPNAEIALVISSNPKAYALTRAENHGIKNMCVRKKDFASPEAFEDALAEKLKNENIGLVVLAGFMLVLGPRFISAYENRIINIHPSLIPSFCGKSFYGLRVHEAALEKGVKVTGATVHFVTSEPDAGPIILQKAVEISDDDTPESLQKKVMEEAEWILLPEAVRLFSESKLVIEDNKVRRLK